MSVTAKNATLLALWLAHEHPQLFAKIHQAVTAQKASGKLSGLGCQCNQTLQGARRKRIGTFGQTGFTFSTGSVGSTAPAGITSWDSSIGYTGGSTGMVGLTGSTGTTPSMSAIGTTAAQNQGSTAVSTSFWPSGSTSPAGGTSAAGSTSSAGFWSSMASDVSSLGSSVVPAVADVASALTSSGGLAAVAGVVSAYYSANPTSTAAQTTAAQVALTSSGQSPATIAGDTLYNADGTTTPVTSSLLSSLTSATGSPFILIALIAAGTALALMLSSSSSKR